MPLNRTDFKVNIRNVIATQVSGNIVHFMGLMGYRKIYEFYQEGTAFFYRQKNINITITKIKKTSNGPELCANGSWLVEVSSVVLGKAIQKAAEDLDNFANLFVPLVDLVRVEYKKYVADPKKKKGKRGASADAKQSNRPQKTQKFS